MEIMAGRTGKIIFLVIVFLVVAIAQAAAQSPLADEGFSRIGAGLGFSITAFREETDLPLNRYCNALTFIIDADIERGKFLHSFTVGFFSGKAAVILSEPSDVYYDYFQKEYAFSRLYAEYANGFRLWGNQAFPGYLGGALRC